MNLKKLVPENLTLKNLKENSFFLAVPCERGQFLKFFNSNCKFYTFLLSAAKGFHQNLMQFRNGSLEIHFQCWTFKQKRWTWCASRALSLCLRFFSSKRKLKKTSKFELSREVRCDRKGFPRIVLMV